MTYKKIYIKPQIVQLAVDMTKSGAGSTKENSTGNGGCDNAPSKAPCS